MPDPHRGSEEAGRGAVGLVCLVCFYPQAWRTADPRDPAHRCPGHALLGHVSEALPAPPWPRPHAALVASLATPPPPPPGRAGAQADLAALWAELAQPPGPLRRSPPRLPIPFPIPVLPFLPSCPPPPPPLRSACLCSRHQCSSYLLLGLRPRSEAGHHPLWPAPGPSPANLDCVLSPTYRSGSCYKLVSLLTALSPTARPTSSQRLKAATSSSSATSRRQTTTFGDKGQPRRSPSWLHLLGHRFGQLTNPLRGQSFSLVSSLPAPRVLSCPTKWLWGPRVPGSQMVDISVLLCTNFAQLSFFFSKLQQFHRCVHLDKNTKNKQTDKIRHLVQLLSTTWKKHLFFSINIKHY
uniref:Uncharacterized protein n=1 Tax=Equus asinus TaxID=9793 RepID=A0A9L0K575_EQUAS